MPTHQEFQLSQNEVTAEIKEQKSKNEHPYFISTQDQNKQKQADAIPQNIFESQQNHQRDI